MHLQAPIECFGGDVFLLISTQERIKDIEAEFKGHLQEQRQRLRCSDVTYWGSAKDKYQLEVPERYLSKSGQVRHIAGQTFCREYSGT